MANETLEGTSKNGEQKDHEAGDWFLRNLAFKNQEKQSEKTEKTWEAQGKPNVYVTEAKNRVLRLGPFGLQCQNAIKWQIRPNLPRPPPPNSYVALLLNCFHPVPNQFTWSMPCSSKEYVVFGGGKRRACSRETLSQIIF